MAGSAPEPGERHAAIDPPPEVHPANAPVDAFISYASHDAPLANTIVEMLERHRLRCWIAPRDVPPGSHYADHIMSAISGAKVLVLVLSESALTSKHVGKEVERASSKGRPVIALRTDAAPLTPAFEYFLSESQWIDAGVGGVAAVAAKLVEAVQSHVDSAMAPRTVAAPGAAGRSAAPRLGRWAISAAAAVLAVLLGYLLVGKFSLPRRTASERPVVATAPAATPSAPAIPEKSIAVLPFTDMSEKKDQEFFADGMAEEIINLLAKAPGLHVPARTSSFYFKGKSTKIPDIARELGVTHVLEGSVRRSGNQIRVTAQLVRADNGYHLWSEDYDRDLRDVFKVQDEIANAVAQALQISLMGGPMTRQKGGTQNLEAYQLYLRASSAELHNTQASLASAAGYLEQAIKLDPLFGLAWGARGAVAMNQTDLLVWSPKEGYERARKFALRAVELSPEAPDPHCVLAYVSLTYDWDWAAAEAELRAALRLDPGNVQALEGSALLAYTLGQWDKSLRQIRAALDRDPLNTYFRLNLGTALYMAGQFSAADAEIRKLIEIDPNFVWAHAYLAKILLAEGKPAEALIEAQRESDEASRLDVLPIVLGAVGRKVESDDALKMLIAKNASTDAYFVAATYAYRHQPDLALQWLDRARQQKDTNLVEIVGEHLFSSLANDARYKAFLRQMNLPE
jgi:TolB-like protein